MRRNWRERSLILNKRHWEPFCRRGGFNNEEVSSLRGERLVATHQSKTLDTNVLSKRVPMCVKAESRLCTIVACGQRHLANVIRQFFLQELTSASTSLGTKDMKKECFEIHSQKELLQKLLKEQAHCSIALRKRVLEKNVFDALGSYDY